MEYYHSPNSIKDALSIAGEFEDNFIYFAGGTDVQIYRKQKLEKKEHIIDLSSIHKLNSISRKSKKLLLGAMTPLGDIITSNEIQNNYTLLVEAAKSVATPVIRKTATIGGNLLVRNRCTFYNQSQEWRNGVGSCLRDVGNICQVTGGKNDCYSRNVSDTAAALIALNAEITLINSAGIAQKPLKDIYLPCGIKFHDLKNDNILTQIHIPFRPKKWWYKKLRVRKTLDFTSLTIAATVDNNDMARICLNGVSMTPILIEESLNTLTLESLVKQARKNCKTVDNDLMPLKYRREMMNVFLDEWWSTLEND
jgi:4-hydroxybenzoyl-CoA reductase subunit beta